MAMGVTHSGSPTRLFQYRPVSQSKFRIGVYLASVGNYSKLLIKVQGFVVLSWWLKASPPKNHETQAKKWVAALVNAAFR